jgi:NYN domain
MGPAGRRLAVLIDAENISAHHADSLFEEVGKLGDASMRRLYGERDCPSIQAWLTAACRHRIKSKRNGPHAPGKNTTDLTLVIDALRMFYEEEFDGFCIVSSDGDFAHLANFIRGRGKAVYGFGEPKAPKCLRAACQSFVELKRSVKVPPRA